MKHLFSLINLCLVLLVPITTSAELTGEIILGPPGDGNYELHITTIENPLESRKIFSQKDRFIGLSVQKNGDLLVTKLAERNIPKDLILFDRSTNETRNLTQGQFNRITDFCISVKGDIVFSNISTAAESSGLFFISSDEIHKVEPKIVRLDQRQVYSVDFSPDGAQVVYHTPKNGKMYIIDLRTKRVTMLDQDGFIPIFSPNGKQIAFFPKEAVEEWKNILSIVSLVSPFKMTQIVLENHIHVDLKWSPDGEYITYSARDFANNTDFIYAIPVNGGQLEKVLEQFDGKSIYFDWTYSYLPVHPAGLMTTTWGDLKVRRMEN